MTPTFLLLVAIGVGAGVLSGMLGIGGVVVIVPALIYVIGFDLRLAIGTSLAVLLAPVGLGAVLEYYRDGNVDVGAAAVLAISVAAGALIGAVLAGAVNDTYLRLVCGVLVLFLGAYLVFGAIRLLGWI